MQPKNNAFTHNEMLYYRAVDFRFPVPGYFAGGFVS